MAPNKITKRDVPYLRFLTTDAASCMKKQPKYSVGNFVRISKADTTFQKGYKQTITDELFKILDIPIKNPPTYSLLDKNAEPVLGKLYEAELNKIFVKN